MNKSSHMAMKFNFKKAFVLYVAALLLTSGATAGFLGYTFRDKIAFLWAYHTVYEKIEGNQQGISSIQNDIRALAGRSQEIIDILIADPGNKIIYSAKKSSVVHNGAFDLHRVSEEKSLILADKATPNVYYRLVKQDTLFLPLEMLQNERKVRSEYNDEHFFENEFSNQTVYLLSYVVDKSSGDKVYFIRDIRPITNSEFYLKAIAAIAVLFFMFYWVLLALWVYTRAAKAKLNSTAWGILTLLTNAAGALVFLLYRQSNQTCYKCGAVQSKGHQHCTFCGAKISSNCPNCKAIVSSSDRYCSSCGQQLKD